MKGFDPGEYLEPKEVRRNDRFVQFAIAVADEAMASAGLAQPEARANIPPERFGVIFGSGIGGMYTFEDQTRVLVTKGPKRVSPFFVPMFIPDMASGMVSIRFRRPGTQLRDGLGLRLQRARPGGCSSDPPAGRCRRHAGRRHGGGHHAPLYCRVLLHEGHVHPK